MRRPAEAGQSYVAADADILTTPTRTPRPENLHQRQAREVQSTGAKPVDFQVTRSAKLQSPNQEGEEGGRERRAGVGEKGGSGT
jgi:hypothetical protein